MIVNFYSFSRFSLNADGNNCGINLMRIGNNKLPPGIKKIVSDGIVLQISNNWFLTFFFSSGVKSLFVD